VSGRSGIECLEGIRSCHNRLAEMIETPSVPRAKVEYYRIVFEEVEIQVFELGTLGNEGDEPSIDRQNAKISDEIDGAE
jgi:hypothetical protein